MVIATLNIPASAQTDLDQFMRQVLIQRDSNWKKLQQYVLDEREQFELRGPSGAPLWGEQRDYTWYVRDGFFVRSPLRVNGGVVRESDRVKYEREFLEREKRREPVARSAIIVRSKGARIHDQPRVRNPVQSRTPHPRISIARRSIDAMMKRCAMLMESSNRLVNRSSSHRLTFCASRSMRGVTRSLAANASITSTSCESSTTRRSSSLNGSVARCARTSKATGGVRHHVTALANRPTTQNSGD